MRTRERWRVNLTCPSCGISGIAEVADVPHAVLDCPAGFCVNLPPRRSPQIFCADCLTQVDGPLGSNPPSGETAKPTPLARRQKTIALKLMGLSRTAFGSGSPAPRRLPDAATKGTEQPKSIFDKT